jgi:DNA-binding MarR family transcriptional regulator
MGAVIALVDRMEAQGWVARMRDLPDRRTIRLALTPEGEAKLDEVMPFNAKAAEEVFAGLTPARLAEMTGILAEMRPVVLEQIGLDPERSRGWPPV